jgi:hypothetical protein
MAVTGLSGTGTWEFSADGATWSAVGPVSAAKARLLGSDALLRFTPAAAFRGRATLSFRAWDLTGTAGSLAAVPKPAMAFSLATETAAVAVNTAPVLNTTGSPRLTPILEDPAKNPGTALTALLDRVFSDPDGLKVPRGLALTGLSGAGQGTWRYSADGRRWSPVGAVSEGSALLLPSSYRLQFVPAADFHGQVSVTYRAWDLTAGAAGGRADATVAGGSTAFSVEDETATLTVGAVNDRPAPTAAYFPGSIQVTGPTAVAALLAGRVADADGDALAIAVTSAVSAGGKWQSSGDGVTWADLPPASAAAPLVLTATARVRFVPNAGFNGSAALRFRAWDRTRPLPSGDSISAELIAVVWVNEAPTFSTP